MNLDSPLPDPHPIDLTPVPRTDVATITDAEPLASHRIEFRVQYKETDGQRRVHHANYPVYFESGRVEMLRTAGVVYRTLEDAGIYLVVTEMLTRYYDAAQFDDWLTLTTELIEIRKVRLRHRYWIDRGNVVIAQGESTIACITHDGRPARLPGEIIETFRRSGL